MIAGFMDLPLVSLATKFDLEGNKATVEHDCFVGTKINYYENGNLLEVDSLSIIVLLKCAVVTEKF